MERQTLLMDRKLDASQCLAIAGKEPLGKRVVLPF